MWLTISLLNFGAPYLPGVPRQNVSLLGPALSPPFVRRALRVSRGTAVPITLESAAAVNRPRACVTLLRKPLHVTEED